jgi:ribosomal protein S18 acetylase RimI-like enzyme
MPARLHMVRRWRAGEPLAVPHAAYARLRAPAMGDASELAQTFWSGFGSEGDDGYPSIDAASNEVRDTLTGKWGPFVSEASVVAVVNGRVVGASLVVADDGHGLRPLLAFLVIDAVHQGRGLGSGLVLETIRRLDHSGTRELHLAVEPANPARMLYRRLGFEEQAPATSR